MPLGTLSVIMPNYNHARFITTALSAIVEQSHRPLEVIVVDDGSTDNSVEVIESFVERDPIVRLLCHEQNQGVMAAIIHGFEASRGDYVFFPAADDYILPGHFEKSLRLLAEHPEAGLSFTNFAALDATTGNITRPPTGVDAPAGYYTPRQMAERPPEAARLTGHTALIRRTAFVEAGGYLTELQYASDWFNCWVVAFRHGACFNPEALTVARHLPTSYYHQCTGDRARKLPLQGNILRTLISPAYRDVLPLFQTGRSMHVHGSDLVRAACLAGLDENPDVVALVATLLEEQLVSLVDDDDLPVRRLAMRAIACGLMCRNGGLEAAFAALFKRDHEMQLQLRELQERIAEVRNWVALRLHRRVVSGVRNLTQGLRTRISNFSTRANGR
jgi:hypothetical protein